MSEKNKVTKLVKQGGFMKNFQVVTIGGFKVKVPRIFEKDGIQFVEIGNPIRRYLLRPVVIDEEKVDFKELFDREILEEFQKAKKENPEFLKNFPMTIRRKFFDLVLHENTRVGQRAVLVEPDLSKLALVIMNRTGYPDVLLDIASGNVPQFDVEKPWTPTSGKPEVAPDVFPLVDKFDSIFTDGKRQQILMSSLAKAYRGNFDPNLFVSKAASLDIPVPGWNAKVIIANPDGVISNDSCWITKKFASRCVFFKEKVVKMKSRYRIHLIVKAGDTVVTGAPLFNVKTDNDRMKTVTANIPGYYQAHVDIADSYQVEDMDGTWNVVEVVYSWRVPAHIGSKFIAHGRKWTVTRVVKRLPHGADMMIFPTFKGNTGRAFLAEMALNEHLIRNRKDNVIVDLEKIVDTAIEWSNNLWKTVVFNGKSYLAPVGTLRVFRVTDEDQAEKVKVAVANHYGMFTNPLHLNFTATLTVFAHVGRKNAEIVFDWLNRLADHRINEIVNSYYLVAKQFVGKTVQDATSWRSAVWRLRLKNKPVGKAVYQVIDITELNNHVEPNETVSMNLGGKWLVIPPEVRITMNEISGQTIVDPVGRALNRFINAVKSMKLWNVLRAIDHVRDTVTQRMMKLLREMYRGPLKAGLLGQVAAHSGLKPNEVGISRRRLLKLAFESEVVREFYHIDLEKLKDPFKRDAEIAKIDKVFLVKYPVHKDDLKMMIVKVMKEDRIFLNPLVAPVFNADFDGDQVQIIPISPELKKVASSLEIPKDYSVKIKETVTPEEMFKLPDDFDPSIKNAAAAKLYQKTATGFFAGIGIRFAYLIVKKWYSNELSDEYFLDFLGRFYRSSYEDFVQKDVAQNWKKMFYLKAKLMAGTPAGIKETFDELEIDGTDIVTDMLTYPAGNFWNVVRKIVPISGIIVSSKLRFEQFMPRFELFLKEPKDSFFRRLLARR